MLVKYYVIKIDEKWKEGYYFEMFNNKLTGNEQHLIWISFFYEKILTIFPIRSRENF